MSRTTSGHVAEVREEVLGRARRVAEVAARHASAVDAEARFPSEAVEALKRERLLGSAVPEELGGLGSEVAELSRVCAQLGEACATTAMVYAMHQIQVLCIVRHGRDVPLLREYLRACADEQRLIASATSELGVGGDVRTSLCAVDYAGSEFTLEKKASVISYGEAADDILVTARRAADASPSDQVLALLRRGEYALERTSRWDALGMRGTCSDGFLLRGRAPSEAVLPVPFADISAATMHPVSHLLWSSVWLGLATSAVSVARRFVRAEARKKPGRVPPTAQRAAELVSLLHTMRGAIRDGLHEYALRYDDLDALSALGFQVRMNSLKLAASEHVLAIVTKAMGLCGIAAYRNDTPYSLGRHMRDALAAGVMIHNDRLYGTNAALLLVSKED